MTCAYAIFNLQCKISDEDAPFSCKRVKRIQQDISYKEKEYRLLDEDTDDEDFRTNAIPKDGVWINVNDMDEPFYDLKEYKPKYIIPDIDITEDSSTGCIVVHVFIKFNIPF